MLFHSPAFIFGFLPLCFLGFALRAPAVGLGGGAALAGRRLAGVLRPVEPGAGRPAARLDPVQLRRGAAAPRPHRRAPHRPPPAARRDRRQSRSARLLQIHQLPDRQRQPARRQRRCRISTSCCRSASRSTPSSRSASWSRSTIARSARCAFATTCCSPRSSPASPPARSSCRGTCCRSSPSARPARARQHADRGRAHACSASGCSRS